ARRLLELFHQGAADLTAPDLLIAEAANVFWKRAARNDITAQEAEDNLKDLLSINLPLVSSSLLAPRALAIARAHRRSVYDCLYLALALDRSCDLVTTDERLANAVGAQFPQINLLRDLQI
ncbi:MAG: type II toxin-antitoxin system VapC family toxin, partial [Blastocatellia bacterium]